MVALQHVLALAGVVGLQLVKVDAALDLALAGVVVSFVLVHARSSPPTETVAAKN